MKKILIGCSLALLGMQAMAQTVQEVDLRTGILENNIPPNPGTLLPNNTPDNTWQVCLPGADPWNPASYGSAYCGIGWAFSYPFMYFGMPSTVKWLSPDMDASGKHFSSLAPARYHYRMTFERNSNCSVQSALFDFAHIGADDVIDTIFVNQHPYPVNYDLSSGFLPASFAVNPAHIYNGLNEIVLSVYNWGEIPDATLTPTGIAIDGKLSIINGVDASFILTATTNSSVSAVSNTTATGTHYWEVFSSATGNVGTYTLVATYTTPSFQFVGAGPCYLVKHTFSSDDCGSACSSQSVCHKECDGEPAAQCNLQSPPTGLNYHGNLLSWNPVPGAVSYTVEITLNDQACCPTGMTGTRPKKFTIPSNSYYINFMEAFNTDQLPSCFSWKVTAYCEDGSSVTSATVCSYPASGNNAAKMGSVISSDAKAGTMDAQIFPNPAKGMVSIDITTESETTFKVSIVNVDGKTIQTFDNLKTSGNKYTLQWNAATVAKGVYLVKIQTADKEMITRKCIVE